MAKSAFKIQMDYQNAVRQANSLEEIANDLKKTANQDLQDCVSEIGRNWTGSNASSYLSKCGMLQSKINKTSDNLKKTAGTIRQIAKNTYDAEMRALALAQIRKY